MTRAVRRKPVKPVSTYHTQDAISYCMLVSKGMIMSNSVEAYHRPINHNLHQQMGELLVVVDRRFRLILILWETRSQLNSKF